MEPATDEFKANVAVGRKKHKLDVAQDPAADIRIGAAAVAFDAEDSPTEAAAVPAQSAAGTDALLGEDLDEKVFVSTASPEKKVRGVSGGQGRGRGRGGVPMGPAAAEQVQIDEMVEEVMRDEGA